MGLLWIFASVVGALVVRDWLGISAPVMFGAVLPVTVGLMIAGAHFYAESDRPRVSRAGHLVFGASLTTLTAVFAVGVVGLAVALFLLML